MGIIMFCNFKSKHWKRHQTRIRRFYIPEATVTANCKQHHKDQNVLTLVICSVYMESSNSASDSSSD